MSITSDLAEIYDTEAKKYAQTRKKPRKEAERIFDIINDKWWKRKNSPLKIIELGCGSGRFTQQKKFSELKNISYTWVDVSQELLKYAKKTYPKWKFICDDMLSFMRKQKQENIDCILAFASFQHISTDEERKLLMQYFYKTLKYGWTIIMTNWALSSRFRKKYKNELKKSIWKFVYSFGKYNYRDIFVPRKWKDVTHYRYYHLFSKKELKSLAKQAWFEIQDFLYLDKIWHKTKTEKLANNSFFILKKEIFVDK